MGEYVPRHCVLNRITYPTCPVCAKTSRMRSAAIARDARRRDATRLDDERPSPRSTRNDRRPMSLANRATRAALDVARSAQTRACAAYDAIAPPVRRAYERTMRANAEYVVTDEARAKRLGREFVYTNLARLPGAIESAKAEMETVKAVARRARAGEVDMQTVGVSAAFAAEVYAWFCVGEIVGRGGKLTGY